MSTYVFLGGKDVILESQSKHRLMADKLALSSAPLALFAEQCKAHGAVKHPIQLASRDASLDTSPSLTLLGCAPLTFA